MKVKPKKALGQHFLNSPAIAQRIADAVDTSGCGGILEIGPGTGVLTEHLLKKPLPLWAFEVDTESVQYLHLHYPQWKGLLFEDFLQAEWRDEWPEQLAVAGNFPYNISSQIVFKILDWRAHIPTWTGMFQKEVADRLCAPEGNKTYGILSALLQNYYHVERLFIVDRGSFNPPPKVQSAVIRATKLPAEPEVDYEMLKKVIKTAFGQRRKTLRNALAIFGISDEKFQEWQIAGLRAEALSPLQFVELAKRMREEKG